MASPNPFNSMEEQPQTFLRVKRRRNENPPSTIRLELLGGWNVQRNDENNIENANANNGENPSQEGSNNNTHSYPLRSSSTATLADSRHSNMSTSTTQTQNVSNVSSSATSPTRRTTSAAIWKRVEILEGDSSFMDMTMVNNNNNNNGIGEKRCRVVEAILEGDGRSSKRRKLTVLGEAKHHSGHHHPGHHGSDQISSATPKKSNIYRILDPVTRLVDDSLNMVHSGDRTVADHYTYVTTDPRLATNARQWLMYRNRGGTLLHACAQWNDVETAHDLLRQSLPGMADAVDDEGRTAYETAQLSGHESISEVLEAFGADTTNFVYDMFVPEEIEIVEATTMLPPSNMMSTESSGGEDWNPLKKTSVDSTANSSDSQPQQHQAPPDFSRVDTSRLLELQGGVGYWTEDGELILEVEPHHMIGVTTEFGHDTDEEYGEEDIDSNCEDYGGNDYPEDESWEAAFLHEEQFVEEDSQGPATAEEYDNW